MGNSQFTHQKMTFTIITKQTTKTTQLCVRFSVKKLIFITKETHCIDVYKKVTDKSYVTRNVFSLYNSNNLTSNIHISFFSICYCLYISAHAPRYTSIASSYVSPLSWLSVLAKNFFCHWDWILSVSVQISIWFWLLKKHKDDLELWPLLYRCWNQIKQ